ncbi:SH2 domain-containing adapter protein F isoform X1 [Ahaetulla prasina]|uniref:SH2 domain-containing adapter protein F isoform X1 n=2 Tax=Ahaetulla prasina TaxID=499056 RepID=UPI002648B1E1|nr:SH2 domain-containing adapter protein F isoform X1 [Ahaetulla prasina]
MARWLRDRLLFRSAKPEPPQPDYAAGPEQPDLLAAYRLQRERDFEDPYGGGSGTPPAAPRRCRSPRRRLIRVEAERGAPPSPGMGDPPDPKENKMTILQDYSDPFDTRQETHSQMQEQQRDSNEGYMEPFEAQKLLAEVQKNGSKEELAAQKPLHLYDTPYEAPENESGPEDRPSSQPAVSCRYSWLPEDDERPPEEYDQPWEWKKERISRVFAVEIEGIKDLPWPPPVGQLDGSTNHVEAEKHLLLQSPSSRDAPPGLQNASTSTPDSSALSCPLEVNSAATVRNHVPMCLEGKSTPCWLSPEDGAAFGEYVNPALPLESQAWYHGTLSRVDAESLLRLCREASYLVRNSESSHDAFSLSLKSSQGFLHMKLSQTEDNRFVLGQHSPPFNNIPEVIHHYASHKLPIQGAEHMSLLYPVSTQPSSCLAAEQ